MTETEKKLYGLLMMYKQYAYDLDRLLQEIMSADSIEKYTDLQQRGLLLAALLEQTNPPLSQG
jgi:hypothetical protein